jgi:hypothetical protein
MRYTLWSRGRIVGQTDLDVHTVTPTMRQGFIEPTPEGAPLLADATGVWRALAEVKRGKRARGETGANDDELILGAMRRREELELELRDENGTLFHCDFIRIYDRFDIDGGVVDEMSDTEEEEEAEFQIRCSSLSGEARDEALAQRAEMDAEIEAMVAEMRAEQDERTMFGSAWPPPPPEDHRWETMQYLLQVGTTGTDWQE